MIRTVVPSFILVTPWKVQKEDLHLHNPVRNRKSEFFCFFLKLELLQGGEKTGQKGLCVLFIQLTELLTASFKSRFPNAHQCL